LGSPAAGRFDVDDGSDNPFVRYRRLLWAYRRFAESGRSDGDFVAAVERLDRRVAEIDGRGFRVTPGGPAPGLSDRLGVDLRVKDETGNVTGTHKARHLMGLALHLEAECSFGYLCRKPPIRLNPVALALSRKVMQRGSSRTQTWLAFSHRIYSS